MNDIERKRTGRSKSLRSCRDAIFRVLAKIGKALEKKRVQFKRFCSVACCVCNALQCTTHTLLLLLYCS
jgi:hypothetical protein